MADDMAAGSANSRGAKAVLNICVTAGARSAAGDAAAVSLTPEWKATPYTADNSATTVSVHVPVTAQQHLNQDFYFKKSYRVIIIIYYGNYN